MHAFYLNEVPTPRRTAWAAVEGDLLLCPFCGLFQGSIEHYAGHGCIPCARVRSWFVAKVPDAPAFGLTRPEREAWTRYFWLVQGDPQLIGRCWLALYYLCLWHSPFARHAHPVHTDIGQLWEVAWTTASAGR
jgi:hypothetical protein